MENLKETKTDTFQHQSLVGGPNPSCCPICNKLCMTGEMLMEHMKFVHKDPNASGVPGKQQQNIILQYLFFGPNKVVLTKKNEYKFLSSLKFGCLKFHLSNYIILSSQFPTHISRKR